MYQYVTTKDALRAYANRLDMMEHQRRTGEIRTRERVRRRLGRVIAEALEVEGSAKDLAAEFNGLIAHAERRLSGGTLG